MLAALPSAPRIAVVGEPNSTAARIKVSPSSDNGGAPVNYVVYYRISRNGSICTLVPIESTVRHQILSPLESDALYHLFVKAINIKGERDSPVINVITKPTRK